MIQSLRNLVVPLYLANARRQAAALYASLDATTRSILVIPPTAAGSVGDAAMLWVAFDELKLAGFERVSYAGPGGWDALPDFDSHHDMDAWFFSSRRSALAQAIKLLGNFSHSMLVGADCIDGTYNPGSITRRMHLLDEHARLGGDARILGSSFSDNPNRDAVSVLRELHPRVVINARDPVSKSRMEQVLARQIQQTADMAFLTPENSNLLEAGAVTSFVREQRDQGRAVVGLNICSTIARTNPGYVEANQKLLSRLIQADYAVLLVPHDNRGTRNDALLLAEAAKTVPPALQGHLLALPETGPGTVKASLGKVDALITGRMHAAILAMGAGTPAISFTYQGKFEGLYQLLDLENEGLLFDPSHFASSPERIIEAILDRLTRHQAYARMLKKKLPTVLAKARSNFS